MKTIGLLGGMSWESTVTYYQIINQTIKEKHGGLHSAKICLYSIDFAKLEQLKRQGKWAEAGMFLANMAKKVEASGAECLLICANTMHKVIDQIQAAISIPILHIVDAIAQTLEKKQFKKVGLLGTNFTMEEDFYKIRLLDYYDIQTIIPIPSQRNEIHRIIYNKLCLGIINPASKNIYLDIIKSLHQQGAEGIILRYTEIPLLIQQQNTEIPLYDITRLHAEYAVYFSLK